MTFIEYLKTLNPEDWNKMATPNWTVKDVVAHMVGWERGGAEAIGKTWKTKRPPWFNDESKWDEFNVKWVKFYKSYTPEKLLEEWEMWQKKIEEEIHKVGYNNLKSYPDLFYWLIETEESEKDQKAGNYTLVDGGSHYNHHYKQIRGVLSK